VLSLTDDCAGAVQKLAAKLLAAGLAKTARRTIACARCGGWRRLATAVVDERHPASDRSRRSRAITGNLRAAADRWRAYRNNLQGLIDQSGKCPAAAFFAWAGEPFLRAWAMGILSILNQG